MDLLAAACKTCQTNLRIPMDFEVETADGPCVPNFCFWDCETCYEVSGGGGWLGKVTGKHRVCDPFKCSGTSAAECGETCPKVPSGVDVKWEETSICDAAMEFPATVGADTALEKVADAVNRAMEMCPCLGKVPAYLEGFDVMDYKTAAISGASELYSCMLTEVCACVGSVGRSR